jgi:hypothetical protein
MWPWDLALQIRGFGPKLCHTLHTSHTQFCHINHTLHIFHTYPRSAERSVTSRKLSKNEVRRALGAAQARHTNALPHDGFLTGREVGCERTWDTSPCDKDGISDRSTSLPASCFLGFSLAGRLQPRLSDRFRAGYDMTCPINYRQLYRSEPKKSCHASHPI